MNFNLSEEEVVEIIQRWNKEKEEKRWKNDNRHSKFIDFLTSHINKAVDSDTYVYNDEEIQPSYTGEEFSKLLYSLYDIVDEYAKANKIVGSTDIEHFIEERYYLKIKNNYYLIELIVGQGSFVRIEYLEQVDDIQYIDYDDILVYVTKNN